MLNGHYENVNFLLCWSIGMVYIPYASKLVNMKPHLCLMKVRFILKLFLREQNLNGAKMNAQRPNGILITAEQRSTQPLLPKPKSQTEMVFSI